MVPSFQRMIELRSPRALKIGNRMLRPRYCTYRKTMVTTTRKTGSNLLSSPNRGASLSKYLLQAGARRAWSRTQNPHADFAIEMLLLSLSWTHGCFYSLVAPTPTTAWFGKTVLPASSVQVSPGPLAAAIERPDYRDYLEPKDFSHMEPNEK